MSFKFWKSAIEDSGCACCSGAADIKANAKNADAKKQVMSGETCNSDRAESKGESKERRFECERENQNEREHGGAANAKKQFIPLGLGMALLIAVIAIDKIYEIDKYISAAFFAVLYLAFGGRILLRAARNFSHGKIFDENFLMSVASIGAFLIGDFAEAAGVMLFYRIGEAFEDMAVRRSKKSIAALLGARPDYANLKQNGEIVKVAPDSVAIGDHIIVKPGEKIPLDGIVVEGEASIDTSSLTGESLPRYIGKGGAALSGTINRNGVLTIEVTKTFGESTAVKIINLVENAAARKSKTENFITIFSRYYTPIVVAAAILIALLPPLFFGGEFMDWLKRGLIFLVISCPCALVISIPLSYFGGIGGASRRGILIKGGNYLEALNNLDIVVFDKTGTLTKGVLKVVSVRAALGFTDDRLIEIAANAERFSSHPIALSIQRAYGKKPMLGDADKYEEISGLGVRVEEGGRVVIVGGAKLMRRFGVEFCEIDAIGAKVYVAIDGVFAGAIVVADEIKSDAKEAIAALKDRGVSKAAMLTGDSFAVAREVARELRIDEFRAELLPDQKVTLVEEFAAKKRPNGKIAFVGDGINDAAALARSDIGIAMGALGSDAAIEAADIVLISDEPSKLAEAIDIARFTRRVVWQNISFALGVKGAFLLLGALGMATMWEAVFADVGVTALAILNAARVLRVKS